MKIVRYEKNGREFYGFLEGPSIVRAEGDLAQGLARTAHKDALAEVRLLAPCVPTKGVCIGLNYRDHAMELGLALPTAPVVFLKPSTSLIGPGDWIDYPELSHRVDYEAELVAVIGRKAKNVPTEQALEYVLGYTCGNDVTARDLQPKDGQWTASKSFDTFMALGPWIETELDPSNLKIRAILNGTQKQSSTTANLIFDVPHLVSWLSRIMTLLPGDVIMTGTPSGIGPMQKGDEIAIEIEGIGTLSNRVR